MKQCPSCSREVESSASTCPQCGHSFATGPKRTMLGLPALDGDSRPAEKPPRDRRQAGTLYGIPAQGREEESEPEWDEEEYDSTTIVPADELYAQIENDAQVDANKQTMTGTPSVEDARTGIMGSSPFDPRATTAGIPGVDRADDSKAAPASTAASMWGLGEESDGTAVAPAYTPDTTGGFAQFKPPADEEHEVGTLLGMSLDELEERDRAAENPRSTQFALPAAQGPDESGSRTAVADANSLASMASSLTDDDSEVEDDSPTMAWNPAASPEFSANLSWNAKSKLEKLREKKHLLKDPNRDTARGIPSAKPSRDSAPPEAARTADQRKQQPRRTPEFTPHVQDDQRTSSISREQLESLSETSQTGNFEDAPARQGRGLATPASGVLKVPKRTNPPGGANQLDTGVLGGGSYSKSRDEITSDQPAVEDEAKLPATEGPVPGAVPPSSPSQIPDTTSASPPPPLPGDTPGGGLVEESWQEDYAFAETSVAPSDTQPRTGRPALASKSAPPPSNRAEPTSPPVENQEEPPGNLPPQFVASDREYEPFASSSTGPKFPTVESPDPGAFVSETPDSFNNAPPAMAPPSASPPASAMPPASRTSFDAELTGERQFEESDGITTLVGRAQSAFGILGGLVLLGSLFVALRPLQVPTDQTMALAMLLIAMSGIGGPMLAVLPVSPGLRGIGFGILAAAALGAFGLLVTLGATSDMAIVLILAGAGLALVAAIFPIFGKLVS